MTELAQLLEKHGIRPSKSLGQNFLHRSDIIEEIVQAAKGGRYALEIGAGPALLSRRLCGQFESVTTVEIDRSLSAVTSEVLDGVGNHTMIYADFLRVKLCDIIKEPPVTAVGNLPYNITGDIIMKLIKNHRLFDKAVVMVQREAAQKLASAPGGDGYRAISVLTQYFCDISDVADVSPDCFIPAPHVYSRVIRLDFKPSLPLPEQYESDFISFVYRVFSMRRKLVTAVFKTEEQKSAALRALESMGVSDKIRGEKLTCGRLAQLYKTVFVNKNEIFEN